MGPRDKPEDDKLLDDRLFQVFAIEKLRSMTTERQSIRAVREGRYFAEVPVTRFEDGHEWAPYLSMTDAKKLDEVRLALRRGDLKAAGELARVFQLAPVAAE